MTRKEHYRKNLALAYPVMIGSIGQIAVGVADSVMVGQLGPVPLAAVSLGNSFFFIPIVLGIGLAFGITPLVANAHGSENTHRIARLLKNSVVLVLLAGAIITGLVFWGGTLMHRMGQDPAVASEALPYLQILALSIVPMMYFLGLKQFTEGLSDTLAAMRVSVAANVLNIGLNYLLIFGHWGFPEMGLAGAGWATFISRVAMAVGIWAYVYKNKRYHLYVKLLPKVRVRKKNLKEILDIGLPSGLQSLFEVSAFGGAAILAGMIGAKPQAAHQIAINLASISYLIAGGFGAAAAIRVGNQLGRRDYKTLRDAGYSTFNMVLVFMAVCGLIFLVGRFFFPTLYTDDAEVISIAANLLIIATLFQIFDGVQVTLLGALRGMSDVRMPTFYAFVAYWLISLPLAWVLGLELKMGAIGIWIGLALGLTTISVTLFFRFKRKVEKMIWQAKGIS